MKGYRANRRPGNRAMTVAEKDRVTAAKAKGCLACLQRGYPHDENAPQPDYHHTLSGGIRVGHMAGYCLCKWHHSDRLIVDGWDHLTHLFNLGPSLLQHPAEFADEFGDDDYLLTMQAEVLAGTWSP